MPKSLEESGLASPSIRYWRSFLQAGMSPSKGEYSEIPGGVAVKASAMDRALKKAVEPMMEYLNSPKGAAEFSEWEKSEEVKRLSEKYGLSKSPSSWEMEQLSFYKSGHELQGADLGLYGVKDFGTLPETPTYREFEKNGEVYKTPENVCAMAGTVVGSDNVKHIVNLLTPWGVVNVKMYAEMYNKY